MVNVYDKMSLITAPLALPVTLDEAKMHLRVDGDAEDALIEGLIAAATDDLTNYTGRAWVPQQWDEYFSDFPLLFRLSLAPVISIDGIFYRDSNGTEQPMDASIYSAQIIGDYPTIHLIDGKDWPESFTAWDAVRVRYTAGYFPTEGADSPTHPAAGVPAAIKAAIKLRIGDLYQNREAVALVNGAKYEPNPTIKALAFPYRRNLGV